MNETSLPILEIVAEHCFNVVFPYLPTDYNASTLLSLGQVALEVVFLNITVSNAPGDSPTLDSLAVKMLRLQSKILQWDTEVDELERWIRQQDADEMYFHYQMQEIPIQLHAASMESRARHHYSQDSTMKHRDRMYEDFQQAVTEPWDQLV